MLFSTEEAIRVCPVEEKNSILNDDGGMSDGMNATAIKAICGHVSHVALVEVMLSVANKKLIGSTTPTRAASVFFNHIVMMIINTFRCRS